MNGYYLKIIIDSIIPNNELKTLVLITISILIFSLIIHISILYRNKISYVMSQKYAFKIFSLFTDNFLKKQYLFFKNKTIGDFSTRLSDVYEIANNVIFLLINIVINFFLIAMFGIFLGFSNIYFLGIFTLYLFFYYLISNFFNRKYKVAYSNSREQFAFFDNVYIKTISSIFSIKTFSHTNKVEQNLKDEFLNNNEVLIHSFNIQNAQKSVLSLLQSFFQIMIIMWGAVSVISNQLTLGSFVFLTTIVQYISSSFDSVTQIQPTIQNLKVSVDRVFSFINYDTNLDVDLRDDLLHDKHMNINSLTFNNVSLSIGDKNILTESSLDINFKKHKIIGIKGKSGIGKSTLMSTLLKLYPITDGQIFVNNIPIENLSITFLREKILLLNQNPEFIPAYLKTISEDRLNRLYFLLKEFGLKKEVGADTLESINNLINNEDKLSGGQKQRLYLSLGLSLKSNVIILDESLSGLNQEWINVFFSYVNKYNISTIIISHDDGILKKTNKVINIY